MRSSASDVVCHSGAYSPAGCSGPLGPLCLLVALAAPLPAPAAEPAAVAFTKIPLTDKFHAEGAGIGDIDKDGHGDAVYGPYWYAGPAFTERHQIYPPEDFDPNK